jgi:hypothetical protein
LLQVVFDQSTLKNNITEVKVSNFKKRMIYHFDYICADKSTDGWNFFILVI